MSFFLGVYLILGVVYILYDLYTISRKVTLADLIIALLGCSVWPVLAFINLAGEIVLFKRKGK